MKKIAIILILIVITVIYKSANSNDIKPVFNESEYKSNLESEYFNKWKGTSWLTLGDSITRANGYQNILKDSLGFSNVTNLGENGQTMAWKPKNNSTYTVGKTINYKNYDLVTIFIGTNDFRYNKKLGSIQNNGSNNFDEKTFIGAYQLLIEYILSSNPEINLVLITPPQRVRDGYDTNFTNEVGSKLIDYVSAIESLGEMYSLPVLNLYRDGGITKENINVFTRDGLHPNDIGYERISDKMYRFLLNI